MSPFALANNLVIFSGLGNTETVENMAIRTSPNVVFGEIEHAVRR